MKFLMTTLAFLSLIQSSFASDFIGGTVKGKNNQMGIVCSSLDNDGKCDEMRLREKWNDEEQYEDIAILRRVEAKELGRDAGNDAQARLNRGYLAVAGAGTLLFGVVPSLDGDVSVPGLVAGVVIDIAKAPIVAVAFVTHKISDVFVKARIKNLVKHMINPEKKGKSKRTRKRYYNSLRRSLTGH